MENQLPMPYPSDEPDETEREYINLDAMPDEALASLVEIELPRLIPLFGLLPDIAIFSGNQPGAPACAPPPLQRRARDRIHAARGAGIAP